MMVPRFARFNELSKYNTLFDYHIHTTQTDGQSTAEEYVQVAIMKGLKEIAFTEHVRKSSNWFDSYIRDIRKLKEKYKNNVDIFYGIEAKALDYEGNIDATEDMINKSELVLGSVHRYPSGNGNLLDFGALSSKDAARIEFDLACAILKNPNVDVLAHPGGVFQKKFNDIFPDYYLEEIIKVTNQYGKAIEINSSYLRDYSHFLKLLIKFNPYVSLGSDAHNVMQLGNVAKLIKKTLEMVEKND